MTTIRGPNGDIGQQDFLGYIYKGLYNPNSWPQIAQLIDQAYDYSVSTIPDTSDPDIPDDGPGENDLPNNENISRRRRRRTIVNRADATNSALFPRPTDTDDALRAISGSETPFYPTVDATTLMSWYSEYSSVLKPTFLLRMLQSNIMLEGTWPIRAKEIYSGPFGVTTSAPILFVGNTFDPITPYTNAAASSALFPGSGLIHQNSFGHCSPAQPSACTNALVRTYWQTGALPSTYGAFCEPDHAPFTTLQTKREVWKRSGVSAEQRLRLEQIHDPSRVLPGSGRRIPF